MIDRCENPGASHYDNYGGSGVFVCQRWRWSFENFLADMGERPSGTSIDRFPVKNGNYEPGNCRWATRAEQSRNTRTNKLTIVTANEIIKRLRNGERTPDIANALGVDQRTIYDVRDGNTWREIDRSGVPPKRTSSLTEKNAREALSRMISGETVASVAAALDVPVASIVSLRYGDSWRELNSPWKRKIRSRKAR